MVPLQRPFQQQRPNSGDSNRTRWTVRPSAPRKRQQTRTVDLQPFEMPSHHSDQLMLVVCLCPIVSEQKQTADDAKAQAGCSLIFSVSKL